MFQHMLLLSLLALIAGCSGNMHGVLRERGEEVSVASYKGLCLDSLQITLPDGETYIGYITAPAGEGELDPECVVRYGTFSSSGGVADAGSNPESVLFSDRMNMMRCELTVSGSGRWRAASGTGTCRLPDSRAIDVN